MLKLLTSARPYPDRWFSSLRVPSATWVSRYTGARPSTNARMRTGDNGAVPGWHSKHLLTAKSPGANTTRRNPERPMLTVNEQCGLHHAWPGLSTVRAPCHYHTKNWISMQPFHKRAVNRPVNRCTGTRVEPIPFLSQS